MIILIGLAPFFSAVNGSFQHDIYGAQTDAGLENFRFILGDAAFGYSLNITVLWAALNVILSLVLGYLIALRITGEGKRKFFSRFLFIPWGIPVYIAIPLWRAFLHGSGGESVLTALFGWNINLLTDPLAAFLSALLVSLWLSVPATAFVLAGHMRKTGRSVLEAAKLEGAGEKDISRYIYLPEIRDSLLAMGVLNFVGAFKEFSLLFMMTAGGPPLISGITDRHIVGATTTLGIFLYEVFLQTGDWGINAAYSVLMAGIVLFIVGIWIGIKREVSKTILIVLTLLILILDRTPFLLVPLLLYGAALPPGKQRGRLLQAAAFIHLAVLGFFMISRGFLQGFHPSFPMALLFLFYKGKEGHFLPLLRGTALFSRTLSGSYVLLTSIILYLLLWISFSGISAVYVDSFLPPRMGAGNFVKIFREERIHRYLFNSFKVSSLSAVLVPLLIFPGAVFLNHLKDKRTMVVLAVIQVVGIAGGMHTLIPLYRIFRSLGWLDSFLPLILIYLYHSIPFALFILTAYLRSLPASFRDMARLEGMNLTAYGFRILLPVSASPIITSAMLTFVSAWNGFQAPLLFLNDESLYTISLKLYSFVGNLGSARPVWNLFAAAAVINTLFIGGIFIRFRGLASYSPVRDLEE